ncbi:MAG: SUMF1/EgtB/PvdO family nonheme iron enzyme, partial [bacterium]
MTLRRCALTAFLSLALPAGCAGKTDLPSGNAAACPEGMVNVDGKMCIDRYEYPNAEGEYPLVNVSWQDARDICESHGKRLCASSEWIYACRSGKDYRYPYGNRFEKVCNTSHSYDGTPPEKKRKRKPEPILGKIKSWYANLIKTGKKSELKSNREVTIPAKQGAGYGDLFTLSDVPAHHAGTFSENNRSFLRSFDYYLACQSLMIRLSDLRTSLYRAGSKTRRANGETAGKYGELFLAGEGETPLGPGETALIEKPKNAAAKFRDAAFSTKDRRLAFAELLSLTRTLYISDKGKKNDELLKRKTTAYAKLVMHMTASLLSRNPDAAGEMIESDHELLRSHLENTADQIYSEKILKLTGADLAEMKNRIIADPDRLAPGFDKYFYAFQRNLRVEYDAEKKTLGFNKADFEIGTNE